MDADRVDESSEGTPVPIRAGAAAPPQEHILELRVHGVSNTPPAALLEVDKDDVQKVRGDSLGSFWELTPVALDRAHDVGEKHHDRIERTVHREAYSWGQMARNSAPAPGGGGNEWVQRLSRAGWMFLVPLGLANTAYWTRRLSRDPGKFARGAGPIRVFGLGLTVLVVMAFSTVSLDLIATQCFATADPSCPSLPGFLAALGTFTWTQRLAVMSLVPVAVLLLLLWLSAGSRVRYEQPTSGTIDPSGPDGAAGHPWTLAHPGLWSRWSLTNAMAQLHLTAGLGTIVLVLAANRAWGAHEECRSLQGFFENVPTCSWSSLDGAQQWSAAIFLGTVVLQVITVVVVWRTQHVTFDADPKDARLRRWWTPILLAVAVVFFLVQLVLLALPGDGSTSEPLTGLSFFPAALVFVLLLVAMIGATWRARPRRTVLAGVGALLLAGPMAYWAVPLWPAGSTPPPPGALLVVAAAGLLLLVVVGVVQRPRAPCSPDPRIEGWRGTAPAVLLVLSLGAVVLLTSLVTVATGDWLNGAAPAQCLDRAYADGNPGVCSPQDTDEGDAASAAGLLLPPMYPLFTVTLPAGLLLSAVIILVAALVRAWVVAVRKSEIAEAPTGEPEEKLAERRDADHDRRQPAGSLTALLRRPDLEGARQRTRRLAGAAKCSERVFGAVALSFAIALLATLVYSVGPTGVTLPKAPGAYLTSIGIWATALLWTALLIRVVTKNSGERPAGLLWDLICFLPRSAHPFGPPCYAERAVPELAGRVMSWLDDDPAPADDKDRRLVVLSAHSLGAVLAVATLFTLPPDQDRRRVALLTYGAQLRPYFGRFFPELLGSQVLGTDGCDAPRLTDRTPWPVPPFAADRIRAGAPLEGGRAPQGEEGPDEAAQTLMAMLRYPGESEPAWINLWRATDPLGMPVASDVPNYVDRAAEELDATSFVATVATHGGYPRTTAYRRAFWDVVDRLR